MPRLTCPVCGQRGDVRSEEFFETRGRMPNRGMPVKRCRSCGSGLIVRPRVFPPGTKAEVIPAGAWQKMEASWSREFGPEDGEEESEDAVSRPLTHYHVREYA